MPDGTISVLQSSPSDRLVDNKVVTNDVGTSVYRQKVDLGSDSVGIAKDSSLVGVAQDATNLPIRNRFAPSTGNAVEVTASGDTIIYTPAAGKRIRLKWIGLSSHPTGAAAVKVQMKFNPGGTAFYEWYMGAPGAFAHGVVRESAVNDVLYVNCDVAPGAPKPLLVNIDVEDY